MTGTFRHATFSLQLSSHFQIHNELWNWHFKNCHWINRRPFSKLFEWLLYFSFLEYLTYNDPVTIYYLRFQACMTFFLQWNTQGVVFKNVFFFIQWKHIVTMNWVALKRAKNTIKVVCTAGTGIVCFWYIKKRSVTKEKLYQNEVFGPNILKQNSYC